MGTACSKYSKSKSSKNKPNKINQSTLFDSLTALHKVEKNSNPDLPKFPIDVSFNLCQTVEKPIKKEMEGSTTEGKENLTIMTNEEKKKKKGGKWKKGKKGKKTRLIKVLFSFHFYAIFVIFRRFFLI